MDQACGERISWVLPFRGIHQPCKHELHRARLKENKSACVWAQRPLNRPFELTAKAEGQQYNKWVLFFSYTWISHSERKGWKERLKSGGELQQWISVRVCKVHTRREVLLSEMFPESWGGSLINRTLTTRCVGTACQVLPIHDSTKQDILRKKEKKHTKVKKQGSGIFMQLNLRNLC